MDLKEFTKQTLVQIVGGAQEANEVLADTGARVISKAPYNAKRYLDSGGSNYTNVIEVDFDVAISVTELEGANGGGGLKVASLLSFGGGVENKSENQTVSRVKYTLPLVLKND